MYTVHSFIVTLSSEECVDLSTNKINLTLNHVVSLLFTLSSLSFFYSLHCNQFLSLWAL